MKKKLFSILLVFVLAITLVACADTNQTTNGNAETENETLVPEPTETPENDAVVPEDSETPEAVHEHDYVENVVKEATCLEDGTASFTCSCGDIYDEAVPASGHSWSEYTTNGDATYLADGTESAVCASCGETETRTAEGSKLAYTYTDCEAVKYAQQTVNVRDLPSTDGNKVGSLSTNQEVKVTGQCNETSWYRIDYNGSVAYVSNKYLGDNKVEVQQSTNSGGSGSGNSGGSTASAVPNPYELPLQTWVDLGDWMLYIHPANESPDPCVNSAFWENQRATLQARYPGSNISGRIGIWLDNGTWSAWMIAVGGTNSYDYPKPLLDFIVKYQY